MLLLLIIPAWLAVLALVVVLCRTAARADDALVRAATMRPFAILDGVVLWEGSTEPPTASRARAAAGAPLPQHADAAPRRRVGVHG